MPNSTGGLNPVEGSGNSDNKGLARASLLAVRVGQHPGEETSAGFDRVVLDFVNHVPGWRVEYVPLPVTRDASGEPVELAGSAALKIRLFPASEGLESPYPPGFVDTYLGPPRLGVRDLDIVETGDFESVLTWHIGVGTQRPFRVLVLDSPHRLVVDVFR